MIRKAVNHDLPVVAELACKLWPDNTRKAECCRFSSQGCVGQLVAVCGLSL